MDDPHRADLRQRETEGEPDGTITRGEKLSRHRERRPTERERTKDRSAASGRHADDDRGRHAERPSEIPKRGWKDIFWRVYNGLNEDRMLMNAAAVTFYSLLALFPAIAALVSIYGLFNDPGQIANQLNNLAGILPGGGMEIIKDQLTRVAAQSNGSLTIGVVISVLVSLWSANGGIKALFDALNIVYGEQEKRSFLWLNAITLMVTLGMLCFAIVALAAIVAVPVILRALPDVLGTIINWARWPVMAVLIAVILAFIYRYAPSRDEPKWRWISWGSVFAAVGWLAFSAIFSFYAANYGTFNQTYGSLGAVVGFMLWMWLSTTVILLGGKLNAEIEHQTAHDTTEGEPEPLGKRGAYVADTVGPKSD
jgi:membrane protein